MTPVAVKRAVPDERLKPGRYRHFKGAEYELLDIACHTETEEWFAVYRAVGDSEQVWVRPVEMFVEVVQVGESIRPRFERSEIEQRSGDRKRVGRWLSRRLRRIRDAVVREAPGRPFTPPASRH